MKFNCDDGIHNWSPWNACINRELEYRVCYECQLRQTEPVLDPPRWVRDNLPKERKS